MKNIIKGFWGFVLLFITAQVQAQPHWAKHVQLLCDSFAGRGYTYNGVNRAAQYLATTFQTMGLQPLPNSYTYLQPFNMSVNTFPGEMKLTIDGKQLRPGIDFLVDPASIGVKDSLPIILSHTLQPQRPDAAPMALLLSDSLQKAHGRRALAKTLASTGPQSLYLAPQRQKPLWWVATDTIPATVVYLYDTALIDKGIKSVQAHIEQRFMPYFESHNVLGYLSGTQFPDTFIILSAHFDHLGTMGSDAVFPGASDNASGVALLLELAAYFSAHPPKYSIAFMLFSGEEAGLLGSTYYVQHPVFPLSQIKMLVNLDIMGDASDGITVVNGTVFPQLFHRVKELNQALAQPLPQVVERGPAANSDHYPFSEAGVPAIFIYSNGGKGFYHDTWDKPETLSYQNIPNVYLLLQQLCTNP
jgi:aminopeptidase YwaD